MSPDIQLNRRPIDAIWRNPMGILRNRLKIIASGIPSPFDHYVSISLNFARPGLGAEGALNPAHSPQTMNRIHRQEAENDAGRERCNETAETDQTCARRAKKK